MENGGERRGTKDLGGVGSAFFVTRLFLTDTYIICILYSFKKSSMQRLLVQALGFFLFRTLYYGFSESSIVAISQIVIYKAKQTGRDRVCSVNIWKVNVEHNILCKKDRSYPISYTWSFHA